MDPTQFLIALVHNSSKPMFGPSMSFRDFDVDIMGMNLSIFRGEVQPGEIRSCSIM